MEGVVKQFFSEWVPRINEKLREFYEEKRRETGAGMGWINSLSVEYAEKFTLSPGKRVRPVLVVAGYKGVAGDPGEDVLGVAAAIELIHAFLLIHDDIMDRDELRRGEPTVWKRFQSSLHSDLHTAYSFAITTGDLVYTYALQAILSTSLPAEKKTTVLERVLRTVEYTGYGQNLDLYLSYLPLEKIDKRDVLKMYELKTGLYTVAAPLSLGAELGGATSETLQALHDYGVKAGTAFQIHDDIIGAFGDPAKTGKPRGSDIREGKKTILVVEAYERAGPEEKKLIETCLGSLRSDCVDRVLMVIEATGALEEAKKMEEKLVAEAIEALDRASISREVKEFLVGLAKFFITREA